MPSLPVVIPRHITQWLLRVSLMLFGVGCSNAHSAREHPVVHTIEREAGLVAKVGETGITVETVRRAARKLGASPQSSLSKLIDLRVYGQYARQGGLEVGRRQMTERSILARALLERIEEQTKVPSTPTDDEVNALTETRWIDLDRPEAVITCHAIVHAEGLEEVAGMSLAQRLADALRPLTQCQVFLERAKAFPVVGAKITAERLPPVTPSGRTMVLDSEGVPVDEGDTFDVDFARAANQIKSMGEQSGVVHTRFGWHVILLESRLPAKHVSIEERRRLLTTDILRTRAKDLSHRLIAESRQRTSIAVERAATETVDRVRIDP